MSGLSDEVAELRVGREFAELRIGQLEREVERLTRERDEMIRAEIGAVLIAMDALGVSAEAVRATAASRVASYLGEPKP